MGCHGHPYSIPGSLIIWEHSCGKTFLSLSARTAMLQSEGGKCPPFPLLAAGPWRVWVFSDNTTLPLCPGNTMPPRHTQPEDRLLSENERASMHSRSEGAEISVAIRVSDDFAWHYLEFKVRARAQTLSMVFSELLATSIFGGRNRECSLGCAQCHEAWPQKSIPGIIQTENTDTLFPCRAAWATITLKKYLLCTYLKFKSRWVSCIFIC